MKTRLRFASSKQARAQRRIVTSELLTACMMLTQIDHSNWDQVTCSVSGTFEFRNYLENVALSEDTETEI